MVDDRLQDRVEAARAELCDHLDVAPPDIVSLRGRAGARRRRLVAVAAALVLVAGGLLVAARPGEEATLTAGPRLSAAADGLAPGEARPLPKAPLSGRSTMASVWTGTEMLLWGGDGHRQHDDGAAYDPRRASWRLLPHGPLAARNAPAAVWTGKEMLLWGGNATGNDYADGAAFDPVAGTWRRIADAPVRSLGGPIGLWTGTEMLVLAGLNGYDAVAYNPASDTWRRLPRLPGQLTGPEPAVVWTGSHVVAVLTEGQGSSQTRLFTMDPAGDTWTALPRLGDGSTQRGAGPTPMGGGLTRLAWTGDRLLAVAGRTVAVLSPDATSWSGSVQLPENLTVGIAFSVWTGTELILPSVGDDVIIIDPARRTWRTVPAPKMRQREDPAVVWADGVLLVWGGFPDSADGLVLRPDALPGTPSGEVRLPPSAEPPPDRVRVAGPGNVSGVMDRNGPLVVWNGRTLPVRRVEDDQGNLIGYFGCHFFERSEVERNDPVLC